MREAIGPETESAGSSRVIRLSLFFRLPMHATQQRILHHKLPRFPAAQNRNQRQSTGIFEQTSAAGMSLAAGIFPDSSRFVGTPSSPRRITSKLSAK